MLKKLITHLTVFQQEGYEIPRFLKWLVRHPFQSSITTKKPLVWTQKVKNILILGSLLSIIFAAFLCFYSKYLLIAFLLVTVWQPSLLLIFGLLAIRPYELLNRYRVIKSTNKIFSNRYNLRVVGITGSFGKTTVKDFLFEITRCNSQVIKTPESFNTIFGIKKVVDYEITSRSELFLCEMGAYTRGEIGELCRMVPPKYGILTAIGSQHLERFGSLANTTLGKFELVDAVEPKNALVNLDNELIRKHLTNNKKYSQVKTYSVSDSEADFYAKKVSLSTNGISFELMGSRYSVELFGSVNLSNIVAAIAMAKMLKVPENKIVEGLKRIKPSPHRLELKRIGKCTLIDNAFSSNELGFASVIKDLKNLKGKKVIITPGIVELGERTEEVHKSLGKLATGVFDKYILVGKSERTTNFEKGLDNKSEVEYVNNDTNLWPIINNLSKSYDWILLENDLTDIA